MRGMLARQTSVMRPARLASSASSPASVNECLIDIKSSVPPQTLSLKLACISSAGTLASANMAVSYNGQKSANRRRRADAAASRAGRQPPVRFQVWA